MLTQYLRVEDSGLRRCQELGTGGVTLGSVLPAVALFPRAVLVRVPPLRIILEYHFAHRGWLWCLVDP